MTTRGVCYVVFGPEAQREAGHAIEAVRRFSGYPVAVIGDQMPGVQHVPFAERHLGRWAKANLYELSPYDATLYMDADTRCNVSPDVGFHALDDGWDLVIVPCRREVQGSDWLWHVEEKDREATREAVGRAVALQGGVFWFGRNWRVRRFFKAWRSEWERFQGQDQGALLRALHANPLRVWLLGHDWNGGALISHRYGMARRRARV